MPQIKLAIPWVFVAQPKVTPAAASCSPRGSAEGEQADTCSVPRCGFGLCEPGFYIAAWVAGVRPPAFPPTRRTALLRLVGNAFSKKLENHAAMVALYFIRYSVTPAMEAGVSNHVWSIEEIVALLGA